VNVFVTVALLLLLLWMNINTHTQWFSPSPCPWGRSRGPLRKRQSTREPTTLRGGRTGPEAAALLAPHSAAGLHTHTHTHIDTHTHKQYFLLHNNNNSFRFIRNMWPFNLSCLLKTYFKSFPAFSIFCIKYFLKYIFLITVTHFYMLYHYNLL